MAQFLRMTTLEKLCTSVESNNPQHGNGESNRQQQFFRMVFILGVNFSEQKLVKKALESFYALGPQISERILAKHSIHPLAKVGSLAPKTVTMLTAELSAMTIEGDARKAMRENIKRLKDMGSYRGRRHAMNLPVRGQRTRNQIETAKKVNKVERKA